MTTRQFGASVPRNEDARLLTGRARFIDDLQRPGLLHAAFLRSPYAHARLRAVDVSAGRNVVGVHLVVHGQSAGIVAAAAIQPAVTTPHVVCPARPLLPRDVVRFVGEAVAVVVADTRYQAEDALDVLEVDYDPLPSVVDAVAALRQGMPQIHRDVPGNCYLSDELHAGAVDQVFADAGSAGGMEPPFPLHNFLLGSGKLGLTQLANLERLPVTGALLVVAPLRLVGGTGSPSRVFAFVPRA